MSDLKVLLDSCICSEARNDLQKKGFDVKWVGDFIQDPGDEAIIKLAYKEDRVLITLDKDFGELAIFKGEPHRGLIRMVGFSATLHGEVSIRILTQYTEELKHNAIITADRNKVRIRVAEF